MSPVTEGKLRLGGMALRNGLLVHGPTHWAAAVRDKQGDLQVASGRKPRVQGVDNGRSLCRRVFDQFRGEGEFDARQFVVQGGVGDAQRSRTGAIGRIDRGLNSQDDIGHESDEGGETQLAVIYSAR